MRFFFLLLDAAHNESGKLVHSAAQIRMSNDKNRNPPDEVGQKKCRPLGRIMQSWTRQRVRSNGTLKLTEMSTGSLNIGRVADKFKSKTKSHVMSTQMKLKNSESSFVSLLKPSMLVKHFLVAIRTACAVS